MRIPLITKYLEEKNMEYQNALLEKITAHKRRLIALGGSALEVRPGDVFPRVVAVGARKLVVDEVRDGQLFGPGAELVFGENPFGGL